MRSSLDVMVVFAGRCSSNWMIFSATAIAMNWLMEIAFPVRHVL